MADGDPNPNPNPDPTPNPGTPTTWLPEGTDATIVGHVQSKGWDKLTPAEAALAAATSHREAQAYIGVPPEQLLRMPKDANDEAGWGQLHERLGVPKEPKDYDFADVKTADGSAPDDAFLDWVRATAHSLKLTKEGAVNFAKAQIARAEATVAAQSDEAGVTAAAEKKALADNWGANAEANLFLAKQGAKKLGLDEEVVSALEGAAGYAKTMEALRAVGELAGEARFIQNGNGSDNPSVFTKEQAIARRDELSKDPDWVTRYNNGGRKEFQEMLALNTIISGD